MKHFHKNVKTCLHVIEIMLIVPFTNAKVERVFSRMNRVKTDFRNRLKRDRLDVLLHVGADGMSIGEFDPDLIINIWFEEKVRRVKAGPHKYAKRKKSNEGGEIDFSTITLSDLESDTE